MKSVEQQFVVSINQYHGSKYKNIYDFINTFRQIYSYVVGRTLIGKAIELKVLTSKYKEILKSERAKAKRLKRANNEAILKLMQKLIK